MKTIAERLFLRYLEHRPGSVEAANNLACALRDQNRYGEAIEALRAVITDNPDNALLWNTLGTVLSEQGEFDTAVTFFHEALRCDPDLFRARYNLGNARLALGDADAALKDNTAALACVQTAEERAMMGLARSTILLVKGEVGAGWDAYEARLEPQYADVTHFMIDRPRWTPGQRPRRPHPPPDGRAGAGRRGAVLQPGARRAGGPWGRAASSTWPWRSGWSRCSGARSRRRWSAPTPPTGLMRSRCAARRS